MWALTEDADIFDVLAPRVQFRDGFEAILARLQVSGAALHHHLIAVTDGCHT